MFYRLITLEEETEEEKSEENSSLHNLYTDKQGMNIHVVSLVCFFDNS